MTGRLILSGAQVFDGTGEPATPATVFVGDGLIDEVVTAGGVTDQVPCGRDDQIDLTGCTLLPGLIDLHVHLAGVSPHGDSVAAVALRAAARARTSQAAGITTVRDVGALGGVAIAVRDAVARREVQGSKVVACGQFICMTGGHGSEPPSPPGAAREADGVDDCRKAVREQVKAGADWVKVTTSGPLNIVEFTDAEMHALVDEAHRCNRRVACHASIEGSIQMAVRAGVDTIEHGDELDPDTIQRMIETEIALVPTLLVGKLIMDRWDEFKDVPMMRALPKRILRQVESFQMAHSAGVTIAAGTDIFGGLGRFDALPEELEYMVQCGMTPTEALLAATRDGARALAMDDRIGTIASGRTADLIAVDGDPTRDIGALRRLALVVQDGVVVGGRLAATRPEDRDATANPGVTATA